MVIDMLCVSPSNVVATSDYQASVTEVANFWYHFNYFKVYNYMATCSK